MFADVFRSGFADEFSETNDEFTKRFDAFNIVFEMFKVGKINAADESLFSIVKLLNIVL